MVDNLPEDQVRMSVIIDRKAADKIEELAKRAGVSKSRMARNLIYATLDDMAILDKLGLVDAVLAAKHIKELIKKKVFSG